MIFTFFCVSTSFVFPAVLRELFRIFGDWLRWLNRDTHFLPIPAFFITHSWVFACVVSADDRLMKHSINNSHVLGRGQAENFHLFRVFRTHALKSREKICKVKQWMHHRMPSIIRDESIFLFNILIVSLHITVSNNVKPELETWTWKILCCASSSKVPWHRSINRMRSV